jgi:hypothetical protein
MHASVLRFDSGSPSSIKPLPRSSDSVCSPLPDFFRPDRAPPSFVPCKQRVVCLSYANLPHKPGTAVACIAISSFDHSYPSYISRISFSEFADWQGLEYNSI